MKAERLVILLVEDNIAHAELVKLSLQDARVAGEVHHAHDGEEALDYLFRRSDYAEPEKSPRPHLVLLDLRLPKIDGMEVLEKIKSTDELRSIPVVILTTSESEGDISRAYDLRANSYLIKPLEFDRFRRLLNDMNFYWLTWNRRPHPGQALGHGAGERLQCP